MNFPSPVTAFATFMFRLIRVVLVLAIAGAGAWWLVENQTIPEKNKPATPLPMVRVMPAVFESRVMVVEALGTVKPRTQVTISPEVAGKIVGLHPDFVEGGRFSKNDLLVRIDSRSFVLERNAAKVRISQAKADILGLEQERKNLKQEKDLHQASLTLAQKELDRVQALTRREFASKDALDRAEQQHITAAIALQNITSRLALTAPLMEQKQAALAMAQVDFEKTDLAVEKTVIRADFDGFVLARYARIGEYVTPAQQLGILFEQGALDVDVRVPMEQMKWLENEFFRGKTPKARVIFAGIENQETLVWDASVARIQAAIDEKTRTLPMTLEIGQPRKTGQSRVFDLRPGAFVTCRMFGKHIDHVSVVPRHLLKPGDRLFLFTDGRLEIRHVSVLRKVKEVVFIDAGLDPGDRIIVSPLPGAVEGMALGIMQDRG